MQFFVIAALAATALAVPAEVVARTECPTGGLYTVKQCCSAVIAGAASLDCQTPPSDGCHSVSKQTACCVLPVAGQAVLCQEL